MKTIEEKAQAYTDSTETRVFGCEETLDATELIQKGFIAGAAEALAGQWRKSDDTEGLQDGERVIVAIQRMDNSIKYFYAAYFQNGKFWYDSDDTEVYSFSLWMRLPEPPKDESE